MFSTAAGGAALYAGGTFDVIGSTALENLARWDGASWSSVGGGVGHPNPGALGLVKVAALENLGGDLYAAGFFATAGGVALPVGIARWDGLQWSPLQEDPEGKRLFDSPGDRATFDALAVVATPAGAQLVLAGDFSVIRSDNLIVGDGIALWDGLAWSGPGLDAPPPGTATWGAGPLYTVFAFADGDGPFLLGGGALLNVIEHDGTQSRFYDAIHLARWRVFCSE